MNIPEILKELEAYTGRFPKKAMRAALERRDAITPELLRVLETVAEDPVKFAKQADYMLHVFGIFLLAQFREERAYPLVTRIVSAPGETPFDLFGDTITEALSRILGSIYDGDPASLQNLVENEAINDYVRGAALDAFLVLEGSAQMPRQEVVAYFQKLFGGRLLRKHSHAWNALVCAVADLPAPELVEDVRRAYDDGLVDPGFADLEGIERDLLSHGQKRRGDYMVITDAIAELEWWASFHLEDHAPRKQVQPALPNPQSVSENFQKVESAREERASSVQPSPPEEERERISQTRSPSLPSTWQPVRQTKVGRNESCPCGSGKKYKKCCGKK